jgi:hypothetical protein
MRSVPFSIPCLFAGLGQCHGVLHDEGDFLRFEFQLKDKFGGLLKSKVKQVRVPVGDIVSVQLTKGWLGASWTGVKIILQAADLATLKEIPGMSQGKVELSIARPDAALAEAFVDSLHTQEEMPAGE